MSKQNGEKHVCKEIGEGNSFGARNSAFSIGGYRNAVIESYPKVVLYW